VTSSLVLLVVTLIVASATAFALTGVVDQVSRDSPVVKLDADVTDDDVIVTHESGDRVALDALELVVQRSDGTERVRFTEFTDDAGGDGRFTAGESIYLGHGLPSDATAIRIVHGETVVYRRQVG
jgi:hypothetical protein